MTYECELSSKSKIYLYLFQLCPNIDLIKLIYKLKVNYEYDDTLSWYLKISPLGNKYFNNHIIDSRKNMVWYMNKSLIIDNIHMVSHPYFLCKFNRSKKQINYNFPTYKSTNKTIEDNITRLSNEPQLETSIFERIHILKRYYIKLLFKNLFDICCDHCNLSEVHLNIYNHYLDYNNLRVPPYKVGPCGVDIDGELLYTL